MTMAQNPLELNGSFEIDPAQSSQGLDPKALIRAIQGGQNVVDMRKNTGAQPIKPKETEPLVLSKAQLAEILEAQIKKHLDYFKQKHNAMTSSKYFDYKLTLATRETRENPNMSSIMSLELSISLDGSGGVVYRQQFGYPRVDLEGDQGHGKLTLFNNLLQELMCGGILFTLARREATEAKS